VRPVGTKYKWTHKTNPETYRVAIQTKDGILQVKAVTDGRLHVHEDCNNCDACWEFEDGREGPDYVYGVSCAPSLNPG
jgi:hypothetical protein